MPPKKIAKALAKPPVAPASIKRISQSDVPKHSLDECISLARVLMDEYNGQAIPHELAIAAQISPTSSAWQSLTGAAVAYGLTSGAYNAPTISITELGKRIISPEEEGDDIVAQGEAALKPKVIRQFLEKYNRGKFPQDVIGANVLVSLGVPKERTASVFRFILDAGKACGFITDTKSGLYVSLTTSKRPASITTAAAPDEDEEPEPLLTPTRPSPLIIPHSVPGLVKTANTRVFITHGKNKGFVDQLKEILQFGKFEPVVAVENETPTKPVPEKVMDDMRSCFAAVIHVDSEIELLDAAGNKILKINDNVLIEIGAALALYKRNFVLLVKKGLSLPSNLQGLYCCFYEGDKLDYEATMKLLKAFNGFEK